MHGLINRAVQCFVRDTRGEDTWASVARRAGVAEAGFEAMLHYEDAVTEKLLRAMATELKLTQAVALEDIGTYLASHKNVEAIRRLLRFSGVTYVDFLHSLDDLRARARLALPDLDIPDLELIDYGAQSYGLRCHHDHIGFSYAMMGILRTMADDYGSLVFLEHEIGEAGQGIIRIQLVEEAFSEGRSFALGAREA